MTTGFHVQNNKAFSDHIKHITSYFVDKSNEEGCSIEFVTEDDRLSNFMP